MSTNFATTETFVGYRNKTDVTNIPESFKDANGKESRIGTLVQGSQNVISTDGEKVALRKGYTLDGPASSVNEPIESSFDWLTHRGTENNLRSHGDTLEYRYVDSGGNVTWRTLATGFSSQVGFEWDVFWDPAEQTDILLFVNGSSNIYDWSGALATVASINNTSISLLGNNALLTSGALSFSSSAISATPSNGLAGTSYNGTVIFIANPTNGDTLTLILNGTSVGVQFVNALANPGDVLIGANLAATLTNLLGLLNAPGTTNATQIAFSGPNQTLVGYVTAASAFTITKTGTNTWAQDGFLTIGTRKIVLNNTVYTYTGGEGTLSLWVTPDPSIAGIGDGIVHQQIRTTANSTITSLPASFENDLIIISLNQVWIGSTVSRNFYVSKQNTYKDFSFSSPRLPAEGAIFTIDQPPTGFVVQEDNVYVSTHDYFYQTKLQLSADLTKETIVITRLKTAPQQGAQSQSLLAKIKNDVVKVSFEPTLDTMGRLENIDTPQAVPISDPIKTDFDSYDFTGAHLKYHKNNLYLAIPAEGLVIIRNLARGFWEAPQILPVARLAVIGGEIYGHSSTSAETYKLFDGTSDNGNPIEAIMVFSYYNYGLRFGKKNFNLHYTEGYISLNAQVVAGFNYELGGSKQQQEKIIDPNNPKIIFSPMGDPSIGKRPIGEGPIGSHDIVPSVLQKFRVIHKLVKLDFYEMQTYFYSNDIDFSWEILCFGAEINYSSIEPNEITL